MYECDSKKFITQSKFKYNNKVSSSNFRLELLTTISINLYSRYIGTSALQNSYHTAYTHQS